MKLPQILYGWGNEHETVIIMTDDGQVFSSYGKVIAYKCPNHAVTLDVFYHNYSPTTRRWLARFLSATCPEIDARIRSGEYRLDNLNE